MKKRFTTFLLFVMGIVSSFAQTYTVNVTPNNPEWGEVGIVNYPQGAIQGVFSVSATKKIAFSQGNLQYQASTNTWRFAEHQYDYIGGANINILSTYSGWIDLFAWGTSGYDNTANDPYAVNFQPWASSLVKVNETDNYYGYGPSLTMTDKNLTGTSANYDWGVYNAISNGGNQPELWHTLTGDEWKYLFNSRTNYDKLWSFAMVNGISGVVLLPDLWFLPRGLTFTAASKDFGTNVYTTAQWTKMENAGAVFLPAAGQRLDTDMVINVGAHGNYWSSTYGSSRSTDACSVSFYSGYLFLLTSGSRGCGLSVRLCVEISSK